MESQVATSTQADTKHTDAKVATSSGVTESPATTSKPADSIELHTLDLDASLEQLEKELADLAPESSQTETSHVDGTAHTSSAAAEDVDSESYFDEELDQVDAKPSHSSHSS